LGATSFGGPVAYNALMHNEVVVHRKWIDDQRFLDIMRAVNLIPGPNAKEVASHLGLIRARWLGLIIASTLFIIPGTAAIIVVAWVYVKYGSLPQVAWVLYGVKPAVIAIIGQAVWSLARKGFKNPLLVIVGLGVVTLYWLGFNEITLLLGGAILFLLVQSGRRFFKQKTAALMLAPSLLLKFLLAGLAASTDVFNKSTFFLSFLKIHFLKLSMSLADLISGGQYRSLSLNSLTPFTISRHFSDPICMG
jgi:chromate transporter